MKRKERKREKTLVNRRLEGDGEGLNLRKTTEKERYKMQDTTLFIYIYFLQQSLPSN